MGTTWHEASGWLDQVAHGRAKARRRRGRVAQLAKSGHASGWGSSRVRQQGSSGRADRLLGFMPG
jgi:hypothetical protein